MSTSRSANVKRLAKFDAKGETRHRRVAAAERHAAVSAAARRRRCEDRECVAAGSGTVRAA